MKRIIALFLVIAALFSLSACGKTYIMEEGSCGKFAQWSLDSKGVLTISGRGAMEDFLIDGTPWEKLQDKVTSIVVEEGITHLGDNSFRDFRKLTSVTLSASVTSMGTFVFSQCGKLEEVIGLEYITMLNDNAFDGCKKLSTITLSEELTAIGRCAFYGCENLTTLRIPASVTFIDSFAFYGWTAEQTVELEADRAGRGWSDTWNTDSEAVFVFGA